MNPLAKKKCVPCGGGASPLSKPQALQFLKELEGWSLSENARFIHRGYLMKNFMAAVELIKNIAQVAEAQNHHPDIHLTGYRKLLIELATHEIDGLSKNDFILAAKIDSLPKKLKK